MDLAEELNEVTMDGCCRDGGNVEWSVGWYALIEDFEDQDFILRIDNSGNKTVEGPFDHIEIDPSPTGGYYSPAVKRMDELDDECPQDDEEDDQ